MKISINGIKKPAIVLHGLEPEFNFGYGVYVVIRTYRGQLFFWKESLVNLRKAAGSIGLKIPQSDATLRRWLEPHRHPAGQTRRIKIIAAPGRIYIMSRVLKNEPGISQGVRLGTVRAMRPHPHMKSLNYLTEYISNRQARAAGFYDCLYVSPKHEVREAGYCSLYIVKGNTVFTAKKEDVLCSVSRAVTLQLAKQLGYHVIEKHLPLKEVQNADECFLSSTFFGVIPVTQIDHHKISHGKPGSVTKKLTNAWTKVFLEYRETAGNGVSPANKRTR